MRFTAFVDDRVVVVRCIDDLLGWFVEVRVPVAGGVIQIDAESSPIAVAHTAESYARMLFEWSRPRNCEQRDTLPAPPHDDAVVLAG